MGFPRRHPFHFERTAGARISSRCQAFLVILKLKSQHGNWRKVELRHEREVQVLLALGSGTGCTEHRDGEDVSHKGCLAQVPETHSSPGKDTHLPKN